MGWNQWVARTSTRSGLSALAAVLAIASAGLAGTAHAGIADTKHNLTSTGTGTNKMTGGAEEICVFCHTPHGSDTSAAVPLWNRKLAAENTTVGGVTTKTYTTYDNLKTSTLEGGTLSVGSVSLACLSCHDGQTSMSAVINAPGSGGYNVDGANMAGSWNTAVGSTGQMPSGSVANLGRDLRNDHPIGIQYAGGRYGAGTDGVATKQDPDFKDADTASLNGSSVWWVDTEGFTPTGGSLVGGTSGKREKTDMILYTRAYEGMDQPFVECASCHDPHSENTTFLRIPNTGSAVCLACHTK